MSNYLSKCYICQQPGEVEICTQSITQVTTSHIASSMSEQLLTLPHRPSKKVSDQQVERGPQFLGDTLAPDFGPKPEPG